MTLKQSPLDELLALVGESVERIERDPEAAYERCVQRHLPKGMYIKDLENYSPEEIERILGIAPPSSIVNEYGN